MISLSLVLFVAMLQSAPSVQKLDTAVQAALGHLARCDPANPNTPCNGFFCKAIDAAYPGTLNADFKTPEGKCLLANQIYAKLAALSNGTEKSQAGALGIWTLIGTADQSLVLERAQACANAGYLTVASSPDTTHGHIVLVVPGQLQPSATWSTSVPSVAGEILNSVGTKTEPGNGTANPMSRHWTNDNRKTARIFVQGIHKAQSQSNACE